MSQKQLTFDYQSGAIRRDFSNEAPKYIFKDTDKKVATSTVMSTFLNIFSRK